MACPAGSTTLQCFISSQADILTNIANNIVPVEKLITGAAYLMGIGFAFKAISTLKQHGENRAAMSQGGGMKEPLLYFVIAAVFIYFPTAFSILMNTTFGYSSVLAYSTLNTNNQALNTLFNGEAGRSLTMIIQLIGLIAFMRGWILISKGSSQGQAPGGTAKGIMHIIGGVLAMNIIGTLEVLNATLYGS